MAAAQRPMVSDERPANSSTERTSRPRLSVPNGCAQLGGWSDGEPISIGPVEANNGAKIDSSVITTRMTTPVPPNRVANRRRTRSSGPDIQDLLEVCVAEISTLGSAGITGTLAPHRGDANPGIE